MAKVKVGDIFYSNSGSKLMVVEVNKQADVLIAFQDNYRYLVRTTAKCVRAGILRNPYQPSVYGVGFMGAGRHKSTGDHGKSKAYGIWTGMLKRCYGDDIVKSPKSYDGVTVCEDWHCYQNFAEWYESHKFYGKGYDIDKDLLVEGNKIYSPETCTLVPKDVNQIITDGGARIRGDMMGITFVGSKNKFCAKISIKGKSKNLGYYEDPVEARVVYLKSKAKYIRDTAIEYHGKIEPKVFDRLMAIVDDHNMMAR